MIEPWQIPKGWAWVEARDIAEIVGGGTPRTDDPTNFDGGDVPWITPADLSGYKGKHISRGARNITKRGLENSGARLMPEGTVLFSSRAPIGYVAIAANPVSTNQGFKSFILTPGINPDYAYYYLQRAKDIAIELSSGTTFREISGAKAALIPLPVAPTAEQTRIVAEIEKQLTRLDSAVVALKRVQANLKRYRASVLKAACEGRLVPTEAELARRENRPYANRTHPQGPPAVWSEAKIEQVLSKQPRSLQSGPFGSNLLHSEFQNEGILAIGIDNVLDGRFTLGRQHRISPSKYRELAQYEARPLDVLITVMATVGRCCVLPANAERAIITKHVYRISVNQSLINPYFLALALRGAPAVRKQLMGEVRGQTRPGINGGILQELVVPLPPLAEQKRVVTEVDRQSSIMDELTTEVENGLQRANGLRQSILSRAFRGKLVPQDPNDEPASVLLERIRSTAIPGCAPSSTPKSRQKPARRKPTLTALSS